MKVKDEIMFIAFAFGSNLGERELYIQQAMQRLAEEGLGEIQISSLWRSEPVDCPEGSEEFINGAGVGQWSGSATELLDLFQKLELEIGRAPKTQREVNAPRVIDLDVLMFGEELINTARLIVPHPRMIEREFVLGPLAEIVPDIFIPGLMSTVAEVFEEVKENV